MVFCSARVVCQEATAPLPTSKVNRVSPLRHNCARRRHAWGPKEAFPRYVVPKFLIGAESTTVPNAATVVSGDLGIDLPVVDGTVENPQRVSMEVEKLFEKYGGEALHIKIFGRDAIVVRHPKYFTAVQKDTDHFIKDPKGTVAVQDWVGLKGLLLQSDVVIHAESRAIVQPAFRTENLRNHMASFAVTAQRLTNIVAATKGEPIEIMDLCKRTTSDIFGWVGLQYKFSNLMYSAEQYQVQGLTLASRDDESDIVSAFDAVLGVAKKLLLGVPPQSIPEFPVYQEKCRELNALVKQILAARRARNDWQSGIDILSFYLREQARVGEEELTDEEIGNHVNTFLLAGEDTTAITLAFTFRNLAEHPEWQQRCVAELRGVLAGRVPSQLRYEELKNLPVLMACINETMRIYPPVGSTARICIKDANMQGVHVPKGTRIMMNFFSMHRNPDIWPRPFDFLPQRWLPEGREELFSRAGNDAFQPFSQGSRTCIGRNFAYIEAQVVAATVLDQLVLENVPEKEIYLMEPLTLSSAGGVWVKALPRNP